jgi:hypothetical protein
VGGGRGETGQRPGRRTSSRVTGVGPEHGLINYIDTKMSSSKKIDPQGALRQVLMRVYRLEIQSVMLVFSTQLGEMLPLFPLLSGLNPPPPRVNKYTVYTYTGGGGYWVLGLRQINTCRKVPLHFTVIFLDDDILHCHL